MAMCSSFDAEGPDFAIYLDYGTDCCLGSPRDLVISKRGIVLRSRWHFPLGTQLAMRFCADANGPNECAVSEDLTGMVVSCKRIAERYPSFEATILFLDFTLPAREGLGRVADWLELADHLA